MERGAWSMERGSMGLGARSLEREEIGMGRQATECGDRGRSDSPPNRSTQEPVYRTTVFPPPQTPAIHPRDSAFFFEFHPLSSSPHAPRPKPPHTSTLNPIQPDAWTFMQSTGARGARGSLPKAARRAQRVGRGRQHSSMYYVGPTDCASSRLSCGNKPAIRDHARSIIAKASSASVCSTTPISPG